ncbi:MAG: ABC transporter permease [Acidobacteria bacterium]|nr:ABC transporter permease [Acidobacteriota bacterium]
MSRLVQDVFYAVRQLRKSPGFMSLAVVTLALGIGANTAIFSILEGVVLAPLPYFEPDRLVMVWESNPRFPRVWDSYPNFQDWQRSAWSFQQMAAFREQGMDLTFPGPPSHLTASQISAGLFSTLGTQLVLGREFTLEENQPGGPPTIVISNRVWKERFGGRSEALGKTVTLDGKDYSIAGVAPAGFRLNVDADVYLPLGQFDPLILRNRGTHDGIFVLARLKAGVSISQSQAEMSIIQDHLDRLYPNENRDLGVYVESLKQAIVGDAGQTLVLLSGAVALVLLIACANVANLLLARSAARGQEFSIRSALGANRARLAQQLLTESVMLSLIGASFGILIAFLGIRFILPLIPGILPRSENIGINLTVLLYTLLVSLVVGILFGLTPAIKTWNHALHISVKDGTRGSTTAHRRAQNSFVIVQVASTLVLLVATSLLLRTIFHLWNVDPGFDSKNIIALKVGISHTLTATPSGTRSAYQQLIERIRQVPGVEAAEFTTAVPLSGQAGYLPFWLDSRKPESLQGAPRLQPFLTGPDYLRTMGMQLLQGRFLSDEDNLNTPCVAVIDRNFAERFFPQGRPLGHTITAGFAAFGPCAIVGVVNHVKNGGLNDVGLANQYQTYYCLRQDPDQWVARNYPDASVVVRSPLDVATLIPAIRAALEQASNDQPIYDVQTMSQIISESMSAQRFPMILLSGFAGLALLLASVGIYGIISYSVMHRMREIGIRMALGAGKGNIVRLFIGQELKLVLTGVAIGALGALILTRTVVSFSRLLYGVGWGDPLTFATVSFALLGLAALAGYIPARRATKVDPIVALRYE